jgi:hypothetical protein
MKSDCTDEIRLVLIRLTLFRDIKILVPGFLTKLKVESLVNDVFLLQHFETDD